MANKQIKNLSQESDVENNDLFIIQKATTDETMRVVATDILPPASVTSEKLASTVAFSAYPSTGGQTLTDLNYTKITLDAEDFDYGENYDTTLSRFTAPVTGVYQLNAHIMIAGLSETEWYLLVLYLNGTQFHRGARGMGSPTETGATLATLRRLEAGDYVEMYVYKDGGTETVAGGYRTGFSGFLVGAEA